MPNALIIGAGNIGRGFLAEVLSDNGYAITFCDVNENVLKAIKQRGQYLIVYAGTEKTKTISGFATVNSATENDKYVKAVAEADLIMTAIGVSLLPKISQQLAEAINKNPKDRVLMACENAIRASSQWKKEMEPHFTPEARNNSLFVDVAVDRIVPNIRHENGDVSVEEYKEMVVDAPFLKTGLKIRGVEVAMEGLDPYISRKLFCVNATHAYIAWLGIKSGYKFIHEAIKDKAIKDSAKKLLVELTEILIHGYGLKKKATEEYCAHVLDRFANTALQDTVERVGRGVIRKIGPNDRFVTPLKTALKLGLDHTELKKALKLACEVEVPRDEESSKLQSEIKEKGLVETLLRHTGLPETVFKKTKN